MQGQPCPRCNAALQTLTRGGVSLFVCRQCGGVGLDGRQLQQYFGEAAKEIKAAPSLYAPEQRLQCPRGCGLMWQKRVEGSQSVDFDVCPQCATTWFDKGEVAAVVALGRERLRAKQRETSQRIARADPLEAAKAELAALEQRQATQTDGQSARETVPWWLFALLTGLPVEGYNPLFRFPLITWTLMLACTGVFFATAADLSTAIVQWGYNPGKARISEQLLTSLFMHAGVVHLLGNMYFLKIFGDNVEDRLGRFTYLVFYLTCGVGASMVYAVSTGFGYINLVGASGAIAGVLGAYLVFFPDVRISIVGIFTALRWLHIRSMWYLPFWFLWQFVSWKLEPGGVAWWAHIGGFLIGAFLAWLLRGKTDARLLAIAKR